MSLRKAKVGDKVVGYPYGIGTIQDIEKDNHPHEILIAYENASFWHKRTGTNNDAKAPSVWPIDDAPDWVWPALGIEKPKNMVKVVVDEYYDICTYADKLVIRDIKFTSEPFLVDADAVEKIPGARVVE